MPARAAHIILRRDDAKRVFGVRSDDGIRQVVEELLTSKDHRDGRLVCESGHEWKQLDHRLTAVASHSEDAGQLLAQCFLGGRPLYRGDDMHVVLVRPDMVPRIATALADLTRDQLFRHEPPSDSAGGEDADRLWEVLQNIRELFDRAAADRNAILFTANRSTPAT